MTDLPNDISPGTLYVVATPIGNPDDITLRALKVLAEVEIIAAEDTRDTGRLLKHHGITGRLIAYHDHNEKNRATELVQRLRAGASVAVVSDAGTPTVSDPGYRLVRAAIEAAHHDLNVVLVSKGPLGRSGCTVMGVCGKTPETGTQKDSVSMA